MTKSSSNSQTRDEVWRWAFFLRPGFEDLDLSFLSTCVLTFYVIFKFSHDFNIALSIYSLVYVLKNIFIATICFVFFLFKFSIVVHAKDKVQDKSHDICTILM